MSKQCLPILDFSMLNMERTASEVRKLMENGVLLSLSKQLFGALQRYGCCYLENPGLSESKCSDIIKLLKEVFNLPDEVKQRFGRRPDVLIHGYTTRSDERPKEEDSVERYETFMTCPRKASGWPDEVNGFKSLALDLNLDFEELSYRVMDLLAVGMELKNPLFFRESHADGLGELRKTIYHSYPDDFEPKPDQLRFFGHCDLGSVTIIYQDTSGGLQVKSHSTGEWLDVKPIPNTVVVMCGQILQRWTNDRIKAPQHRVLIPSDKESRRHDRFSMSFFPIPEEDFMVEPFDGSDKYKAMPVSECYLKRFAEGDFNEL